MKSTKEKLDKIAAEYDSSKHFDSVIAYYDVVEIKKRLCGNNVLEVGTSGGTVTKHILPLVKKLDVMEGSKLGISRTKKLLGRSKKIRYFNLLWEDFKPKEKYSDILFIRGLEHVNNPIKLLAQMKSWLKKEGVIHIIVPNAESWHRRRLVKQGKMKNLYSLRKHDLWVGHKRVYDVSSLKEHVEKSGLKIISSKKFFVKPLGAMGMGKITMNPKHPIVLLCYYGGKLIPSLATQIYIRCKKN